MAAPLIRIEVITPERTVLWDRTESIIAPALDGYLGIQANHARWSQASGRGCSSTDPSERRNGAWRSRVVFWKWRTIT